MSGNSQLLQQGKQVAELVIVPKLHLAPVDAVLQMCDGTVIFRLGVITCPLIKGIQGHVTWGGAERSDSIQIEQ